MYHSSCLLIYKGETVSASILFLSRQVKQVFDSYTNCKNPFNNNCIISFMVLCALLQYQECNIHVHVHVHVIVVTIIEA